MTTETRAPSGMEAAVRPKALRCPFCGGESFLVKRGDSPSILTDAPFMACRTCGAQGPEGKPTRFDENEARWASAIAAWNKRAEILPSFEDGLSAGTH